MGEKPKRYSIKDLEKFFEKCDLPAEVDMHPHGKIVDVPKFIDSHLSVLKAQSGNRRMMPFYDRLVALREKLG